MSRTSGVITLLLAAAASGPLVFAQQSATQKFRLGVEVVSLNVTATDPTGRYVTDIPQAEFDVFEDGVKQELVFFSHTRMPIALALLLDTSASMEERLPIAQEAATGFAKRLGPDDTAEVIDFDSNVNIVQAFTHDMEKLDRAIRSTSVGGSTALYNAIYISLNELRKQAKPRSLDEIHRQAIVVLSDGDDTSSLIQYEDVLDRAKRSETAIYAIGLRSRDNGGRGFKEAEFVLRQLSQETGGRAFFPSDARELPKIYDTISEELSSQYTLGYTSKNSQRNGQWRRVVVRINRPGVLARTKQGYYAPSPAVMR
jgi:Ca-activated chloride channel family protein